MEIKLTVDEDQAVRKVAQEKAKADGISEKQALKELLAIGVNSWHDMKRIEQLTGRKKDLK